MSIHPLHHCGKEVVSDESGKVLFVRYRFVGRSFSREVQALWLQGKGVRSARLKIGGQLLGVSRVTPDQPDRQRLHFTLNDAALPLHLLRHHDMRVELVYDKRPSLVHFWWQEVSWRNAEDEDERNRARHIYVETEKPEGAHNMWVFAKGMAGVQFAEGFDTHRQLLQAHVSR